MKQALVYSNGGQESERAVMVLEACGQDVRQFLLGIDFTHKQFKAEFGEEAEVEPNLPKWFGEDGEWIYGVQKDMVAPVPICAICGGDIPKRALICRWWPANRWSLLAPLDAANQ